MKRFFSMLLIMVGAVVGVWGGYHLFNGAGQVKIPFTNDVLVSPMILALAGLGTFTIGLIGYRE
jgi:hypothetical protein